MAICRHSVAFLQQIKSWSENPTAQIVLPPSLSVPTGGPLTPRTSSHALTRECVAMVTAMPHLNRTLLKNMSQFVHSIHKQKRGY